jgi:hypothetical protein
MDILGVEHDENHWLDDMWPELEGELREKVGEAMTRVGKKITVNPARSGRG